MDGALAARGTVHEPLLDQLLAEPYYALPAPKTTGKELFHLGHLRDALTGFGTLTAEDVIATLTRLTARTVADAVRSVGATEVIASGGGTRNPALMAMLDAELPGVPVRTSDALGLRRQPGGVRLRRAGLPDPARAHGHRSGEHRSPASECARLDHAGARRAAAAAEGGSGAGATGSGMTPAGPRMTPDGPGMTPAGRGETPGGRDEAPGGASEAFLKRIFRIPLIRLSPTAHTVGP